MDTLDKDVINLAKAIRQAESGNRAVLPAEGSKLGGASRYQYTHDTWKGVASKYLGNPNAPITLENENKATYLRIKEWKDKGYNPAQIASMWNAGEGRPDAYKQNWRGTNKYGVAYDTPKYVNKVYSLYKQQKGEQAPQGPSTQPPTVQMQRIERQQQGLPVARNENRVEPTLVGGMVREALGGGFAKLGESIRAIPKAIRGEDINKPRYSKYLGKEVSRIGAGFDVTKGLTKENLNAVKDSGAVGLEFASYLPIAGVVGKTAGAIPTLAKIPAKQAGKVALKRIGMNAVEGTVGTAMYEGARRLQGEKDRGNFFENVAYGGVGGLALGTLGAGLSRGVRQARRTIASVGGNIPQDIAEESTQRLKGAWTELNDNYKDLRNFRNKQAKYGRNIEDVLTEEVMVPEIKDGKVDVQKLLPEVDARIQKQAEQVTEFAKKFDDMPVPIKDVEAIAKKVIRETESITATGELKSALSEVARRMEGIKEVYGETLLPSQLNTIRVQMNQLTKAFGGDVFKQDVADAIADAVRDKLDEVIQDDVFRRANAKVGDLINVRKYLQKVDGKQVGGGRFSQAFAGVIGSIVGGEINKGGLPVVGPVLGALGARSVVRGARQYAFGSAGPRTRAILRRMQRKNEVGAEIAEKTVKKEQKLLPARTSDNNIRLESGKPINLPPRSQSSVDKTEMANIILQRSKKGDVFELNGKDLEITRVLEDGVMVVDNNGNKDFITKADIVGAKKVNPLFGEAEGEVVSEMLDLSVAGKRIMKEDGSFMAQKSTFPKWISEDLRSMALFKSVINKIKENKPIRGSKEQRLYNEIKDEITSRSIRKSDELAKAGEISLAQKANEMSLEDFTKFYEENKASVKPVDDIKKFWEENNFGGEQAFGAIAGMEIDENGEIKFNKDKALMGVAGMAVAKKAGLMPKPKKVINDLAEEAKKYKTVSESKFGVRFGEEVKDRAIQLYKEGKSSTQISKEMGISSASVLSWTKKAGIKRTISQSKVLYEKDIPKVIELYKQGKNTTEISKELNLVPSSVARWVKEAGITRSNSEAQSILAELGKTNVLGVRSKVSTKFGVIPADSTYEAIRIKQLEADPNIVSIKRATRIPFGENRHYVPDIEIKYKNGSTVIEEIKPVYKLGDEKIIAKEKAAREFYKDKNTEYRIITENDIGVDAFKNANLDNITFGSEEIKLRFLKAINKAKSKTKSQLEEIWNKANKQTKPNPEAGNISSKLTNTIGATTLGATAIANIPSKTTYQRKEGDKPALPEKKQNTEIRELLKNKIVGIENEGELARGEDVYKTVGVTGDLGKYQVSPSTLKAWSKVWLGKEYLKDEFLKDEQAQEKFFENFLDIIQRLNLTPEESAVAWHLGWGELGTSEPREIKDKKFKEALDKRMKTKNAINYLNKFNSL